MPKRFLLFTMALLAYFAIYGFNLQFPAAPYYDEVYQVKTAQEITSLSGYTETSHPPLAMLLMAGSILAFGDHSWAWRIPSLVAGLGSLFLVFAIARRLSGNSRTAFFAAFIFFFDGLSFTQARIGMLNATMLFFMLLSLYLLLVGRQTSSAVAFGLAAATRWVGFSIAAPLGLLFLKNKSGPRRIFLFVLPAAAAYFIPFLIFPFLEGFDWRSIGDMQTHMLHYHLTLKEGHAYGSSWWTWHVLTRPIWYFFEESADTVRGILSIGNPAVFWVLPPAIIYALDRVIRKKSWLAGFVLFGFLTQWFQWVLVSRVKFFHYFYTAMPFAAMVLAIALERIWSSGPWGRRAVMGYLLAVAALFFYWYPLLNGLPIPRTFYTHHLWFKSWV